MCEDSETDARRRSRGARAGAVWMTAGPWARRPACRARRTATGRTTRPTCAAPSTSPLDQINAANFNKLEVAWRFKTDNLGTRPEYKLEGTPLVIKGVLYTTAGTRRSVVALDGRTGEADLVAQLPRRQPRRDCAAPVVGPRRVVLDRRQGRRAHPLRHDRLSPGRAQREERRDDSVVRQGRRRRPEEGRGLRQGPADRSRDRRDRAPLDADRRQGRR